MCLQLIPLLPPLARVQPLVARRLQGLVRARQRPALLARQRAGQVPDAARLDLGDPREVLWWVVGVLGSCAVPIGATRVGEIAKLPAKSEVTTDV